MPAADADRHVRPARRVRRADAERSDEDREADATDDQRDVEDGRQRGHAT